MDKRKGYDLLLINAGIRNSVSERKKSCRLLHYFSDLFQFIILDLHTLEYVKKLSNEKNLDTHELDENFFTSYKIPRYIEW
jgi:hypothetical protein